VIDHPFVPVEGTSNCGRNIRLGSYVTACIYPKSAHREETTEEKKDRLLEMAWGVIANAGGGDWTKETLQWQGAAHSWGVQAGYRLDGGTDCEPPKVDES